MALDYLHLIRTARLLEQEIMRRESLHIPRLDGVYIRPESGAFIEKNGANNIGHLREEILIVPDTEQTKEP